MKRKLTLKEARAMADKDLKRGRCFWGNSDYEPTQDEIDHLISLWKEEGIITIIGEEK